MPKSLADGHTKFTILTTPPANPAAPTVAELTAGIDASCRILASDFNWTATDSDKVAEKALCDLNNVNAISASNFTTGFTIFRYFNATTGVADAIEDALFTALKSKGSTVYGYARKTGKTSLQAWAGADEIYLGGAILLDLPQEPSDAGGYIKKRIPSEPQSMFPNIAAAA